MTQANTPNGRLTGTVLEGVQYSGIPRIPFQDLLKNKVLTNFGSSTKFKFAWAELEQYLKGRAA
jgi:hypothetical protein